MNQDVSAGEIFPPERSRSGTNAHYHFCHIRGGQQNYGVCLFILEANDQGRLDADSFIDCQRACTRGDCEARKMQEEEKKAGRALYYKPRTNINPANTRSEKEAQESALTVSSGKYDMTNDSFARGWAQVGAKLGKPQSDDGKTKSTSSSSSIKPPRAVPPKPKTAYIEEGFADLVNVIASDKPKATPSLSPSPSPAPTKESIKPLPGETPIEFARRRAALLKGNS